MGNRLLVLVVVLVLAVFGLSAFADNAVLDQSQTDWDAALRVSSARSLCQTFTAEMNGPLVQVDVLLAFPPTTYDQLYPATIRIVGTVGSAPDDSNVLWTGSFSFLAQGWFPVDTSNSAPFLLAGSVYGIEVINDDLLTGASHDAWDMQRTGNPYQDGSAWEDRGGGWVSLSNGSGVLYPDADAAFRTYVLEAIAGDANLDGVVDAFDYIALKRGYGKAGEWSNGDFNVDGYVDLVDLQILVANFGNRRIDSLSVPEPTTMLLLGPGAFALIRRRHR